jgi:hypothetical protein
MRARSLFSTQTAAFLFRHAPPPGAACRVVAAPRPLSQPLVLFARRSAAAAAAAAAAAPAAVPASTEASAALDALDSHFSAASADAILASILGLGAGSNDETLRGAAGDATDAASGELLQLLVAANELARSGGAGGVGALPAPSKKPPSPAATATTTAAAPAITTESATRVFAALAPQLTRVPVVLLARLLCGRQWPRAVLPQDLERAMRREVFARCGDLRGSELARVLVLWSLPEAHAADMGMFRKLGKLLAYHVHTVDSPVLLLQALRALKRARVKPPADFLDVVGKRIALLLARSSAVAGGAADADTFSVRDSVVALRLCQELGGGVSKALAVATVRVAAARFERRLVDGGFIARDAPDLLNEASTVEAGVAAAASSASSALSVRAITGAAAMGVLEAERVSPLMLAYLLTAMGVHRVATVKYTRPLAVLVTGLCASDTGGLSHKNVVGVLVPALSRFPIQRLQGCSPAEPARFGNGDWAPTLVRQLVAKTQLCSWEQLIHASRVVTQYLESCEAEAQHTVTDGDRSALAGAAVDAVPFFAAIADRLADFRRAPTSWQSMLLARYMQRAAKCDLAADRPAAAAETTTANIATAAGAPATPAGSTSLQQVMRERFLPPIVRRLHVLLNQGLVPLHHYDHLIETLTHAGFTSDDVARLRELRRAITDDPRPYSARVQVGMQLWKPLAAFNEDHQFGDTPDASERDLLRGFAARELAPHHPVALLRLLEAFDAAFPRLLQPAVRREFAFVLDRMLGGELSAAPALGRAAVAAAAAAAAAARKAKAGEASGAATTATTAAPAAVAAAKSTLGTATFSSKEQLREFVDLLWRVAPQANRTSPAIWANVAARADALGDAELAAKARQVSGMLSRLKL